jgi:hypothetical protein
MGTFNERNHVVSVSSESASCSRPKEMVFVLRPTGWPRKEVLKPVLLFPSVRGEDGGQPVCVFMKTEKLK